MKFIEVIFVLASLIFVSEGKPVYPIPRWFDYDYFPSAKPIVDSGTGQVVETVNPLRPYEPWILDCPLLFHADKGAANNGKRHERCKEVDEENEREYAKFLHAVQKWEAAYPERATRWNSRFPDAKDKEKAKYALLKKHADMHKPNVSTEASDVATSTQIQHSQCPPCKHERDNNAKKEGESDSVDHETSVEENP